MRKMLLIFVIFSFSMTAVFAQNPYQPVPYVKIKHPEWARRAVVYQINTRALRGKERSRGEKLCGPKDRG